jgi:hypothetical protein
VFLRKDSDRISKLGKEFKIPQHWSHFGSTSEEQKAACEARVSSYTEADRQRIQSQARGQRLKLIQRWFWDAYTFAPNGDYDPKRILANYSSVFRLYIPLDFQKNVRKMMGDIDGMPLAAQNACQGMFLGFRSYRDPSGVIFCSEMQRKFLQETLPGIDRLLHEKICVEVWSFLGAKKQRQIAEDLFVLSFHNLVDLIADGGAPHPGLEGVASRICEGKMMIELSRMTSAGSVEAWNFAQQYIIARICCTPWASEFARLEAEAGQKVAA